MCEDMWHFEVSEYLVTQAIENPDLIEQEERDELRELGYEVKLFKNRIPKDERFLRGDDVGAAYFYLPTTTPKAVAQSIQEAIFTTFQSENFEVEVNSHATPGALIFSLSVSPTEDVAVESDDIKFGVLKICTANKAWGIKGFSAEKISKMDLELFARDWGQKVDY